MPGLIRGVARTAAVVGTATAVSNRVSRRQAGKWSEQEEKQAAAEQQAYEAQQYQAIQAGTVAPPPQYQQAPPQYQQAPPTYQEAPPPPPAPAPPPPPAAAPPADTGAKLAQLQQLGELKAQGILTDVEFEIQKQKILNT
jgi:hypothetical protein